MNILSGSIDVAEADGHKSNESSCCKKIPDIDKATHSGTSLFSVIVQYQPIIVITFTALIGGAMITLPRGNVFDAGIFMHSAMGLFLLPLALLKLFNLNGFVNSYVRYDILASIWRPYGYLYPFLELALSLLLLSGLWLYFVYIATLVVMGFGSIGIISQLVQGKKLDCACVGAVVKVPLGFVSILENVGMAIMAIFMISMY